jgi:1-deoxyxylulose-5-phosphate synthase
VAIAKAQKEGRYKGRAPRFALGTAARRYQERYWNEKEFETIEALRPIAAEAGMTMATLAVSWVLSNPAITAPIIGASRPGQLADSLAAAEKGTLPADLKARLDDLTHGWRAVDADR